VDMSVYRLVQECFRGKGKRVETDREEQQIVEASKRGGKR